MHNILFIRYLYVTYVYILAMKNYNLHNGNDVHVRVIDLPYQEQGCYMNDIIKIVTIFFMLYEAQRNLNILG